MVAQGVQLFRVGQGHRDFLGLGFEAVHLGQQGGGVFLANVVAGFDLLQILVFAEHAGAHAELVHRRHDAAQREQHGQQDTDDQPHALQQAADPERQVAVEQGRPAVDGAVAFGAHGQLAGAGVGEFAGAVEPACAVVLFLRHLGQQLAQGRVGVATGQQRGGGGHQAHVFGRQVGGQVHDAARQGHTRQKGQVARIGLTLAEIHQPHARGLEQGLHDG